MCRKDKIFIIFLWITFYLFCRSECKHFFLSENHLVLHKPANKKQYTLCQKLCRMDWKMEYEYELFQNQVIHDKNRPSQEKTGKGNAVNFENLHGIYSFINSLYTERIPYYTKMGGAVLFIPINCLNRNLHNRNFLFCTIKQYIRFIFITFSGNLVKLTVHFT